MFCFSCGIMGHNEEFCPTEIQKKLNPEFQSPFGSWIRSTGFRRNLKEPTRISNKNNHMSSPNTGFSSLILETTIRKLGLLKIVEPESQQQGE